MKKIVEIYYLEKEERDSCYKDGFRFICEDGTIIETCSTDVIAHDIFENGKPRPKKEKVGK